MSCGDPHDVDCREVLTALDAYLDGEETPLERALIEAHLEECTPCLQEQHIEALVKARLARACGSEACSDAVRTRVIEAVRQIRVTAGGTSVTAQVTYTRFETR